MPSGVCSHSDGRSEGVGTEGSGSRDSHSPGPGPFRFARRLWPDGMEGGLKGEPVPDPPPTRRRSAGEWG